MKWSRLITWAERERDRRYTHREKEREKMEQIDKKTERE